VFGIGRNVFEEKPKDLLENVEVRKSFLVNDKSYEIFQQKIYRELNLSL